LHNWDAPDVICLESLEALRIVANHTEDGMTRWYLAELQKAG